jgi:hypothetical protein
LYSNLQARNSWKSQGFGKALHQYRVSGTTLRCVEFLTSISSYTKKGAEKRAGSAMKQIQNCRDLQSLGFGDVWWVDFIRLAPKHSRIFKNIQELEESKRGVSYFDLFFHNWWAHEFHGSPSCEVVRRPQGSRGAAQAATPRPWVLTCHDGGQGRDFRNKVEVDPLRSGFFWISENIDCKRKLKGKKHSAMLLDLKCIGKVNRFSFAPLGPWPGKRFNTRNKWRHLEP